MGNIQLKPLIYNRRVQQQPSQDIHQPSKLNISFSASNNESSTLKSLPSPKFSSTSFIKPGPSTSIKLVNFSYQSDAAPNIQSPIESEAISPSTLSHLKTLQKLIIKNNLQRKINILKISCLVTVLACCFVGPIFSFAGIFFIAHIVLGIGTLTAVIYSVISISGKDINSDEVKEPIITYYNNIHHHLRISHKNRLNPEFNSFKLLLKEKIQSLNYISQQQYSFRVYKIIQDIKIPLDNLILHAEQSDDTF